MIRHRTRVHVRSVHGQIALRDWLVEPSPDDIHPLVRIALHSGVAADGMQIIVGSEATRPVPVELELWEGAPDIAEPGTGGDWEECHALDLTCPSGGLYVDQLEMPAIDLEASFPLRSGVYGVHLYRRGRVSRASGPVGGDGSGEEYLIRMWRSGDLPAAIAAEYADDDGEDPEPPEAILPPTVHGSMPMPTVAGPVGADGGTLLSDLRDEERR